MNYSLLLLTLLTTQSFALYDKELDAIENKHGSERVESFNQFYQKKSSLHLDKDQINSLTKNELLQLIEVFERISFYIQNDVLMRYYSNYFAKLIQKKWENKTNVKKYYSALILNRDFLKASNLHNKIKDKSLEPLPKIIDAENLDPKLPIVYALNLIDTNTLIKENHKFGSELNIIVVAHPLCHFCRYAAHAISEDKKLLAFFKQHSYWFSPADGKLSTGPLLKWHKVFPEINLRYINKFDDFPNFDSWATPTFYFIKNNQIVSKLQGWPKEGRIKELKALIKKHFVTGF